MLSQNYFDILALNETRLDQYYTDVCLQGYNIVRHNRNRSGGGVCIYVRKSINFFERTDLVPENLEVVCIEVTKPNSRPFIVSSIYKPPSAPVEIFDSIERMIGLIDNEDKETYILGDLNCNLLDQTNLDNDAKHLLRVLEIYQLTLLITKPTRITQRSKSLLDVCIASCPEKIIHSDVFHVGRTDHSLVYAVRKINSLPKCNRTREMQIFNRSVVSHVFPTEWKVAQINALHKKGPRNMLENYRPISILPVVSRVFEMILYKQLVEYLEAENLLSEHQFGFRSSHSTVSALLDCSNQWYCNMDRGLYNLVIFLDQQKAFDTVNHALLLGKLEACGIRDDALNLLASYLADRKQTCQVNGKQSGLRTISCGIPQGSILGPLFSLVYINDLPNCLKHATPRMFADDTSLTAYGKVLKKSN